MIFLFLKSSVIIAKKTLIKIKPSVIPGICWLIISTILLTLPGSSLPSENWLDKIWFDKWVHIGLFGILVFLFCWGVGRKFNEQKRKKVFVAFIITGAVYGIIMEFIQRDYISGRSFDSGDILADIIGCLGGWWLAEKRMKSSVKK